MGFSSPEARAAPVAANRWLFSGTMAVSSVSFSVRMKASRS